MKELPKKYRIKDIAKLAGVSAGTVDRVLHNRGEVSEKSRAKIMEILKEIDYHPNVFASTLASKKAYTFICVLPSYEKGEYFESVETGIAQAAEEFGDWNITIQMHYFDQFEETSFQHVINELPAIKPDAVLLVPTFKEITLKFIRTLEKDEIPYVFLDSTLADTNPLTYLGQNSYQSGYLAAKLLTENICNKEEIILFRMMRQAQSPSNQTSLRELGFLSYLKTHPSDFTVHEVQLNASDEKACDEILDHFFRQHPKANAAVIFNSRAYIIGEYIKKRNMRHISLVGYDLLDRNVTCLKQGVIHYLIGQRPERQGYIAIKALVKHFVLKQPVKKENFMPMDILTKENIDFFFNPELD
ncbi:MAG: substrate-binding domain-containing protein [Candidatus Azobacteroides sp.]|nr:substrate-binding domain-containing protein [Candidatus Azobacteroides sp.]